MVDPTFLGFKAVDINELRELVVGEDRMFDEDLTTGLGLGV